MKINKYLTINIEAHKGWSKEQFITEYKGKCDDDINELWLKIEPLIKDDRVSKLSGKSKEVVDKGSDASTSK